MWIEFVISSAFALGVLASISGVVGLVLGIAGYIDAQRAARQRRCD